MCHHGGCFSLKRNICVCFTVYVLFGLRTNCGVSCHAHADLKDHHMEKLFRSITNGTTISQQELDAFLLKLHLKPSHYSHDDHHSHADHHSHEDHHSETVEPHCYSAQQMFEYFPDKTGLDRHHLHLLLPLVVYEISSNACLHHREHEVEKLFGWKVIVACVGAVLVISISGIVVVAVLPYMPRSFYNVVTQFLIALSVGSLIGDAFLHLIPHALYGEHEHDHSDDERVNDHSQMITKSVVAVLGVYVFFLMERLTILCQNKRSRRKTKRDLVLPLDENAADKRPSAPNGTLNKVNKLDQIRSPDWKESPKLDRPCLPSDDQKIGNNVRRSSFVNVSGAVSEFATSCEDNRLCNRPPERPLDNTRCEDHLKGYLGSEAEHFVGKGNDAVHVDLSEGVFTSFYSPTHTCSGDDPKDQAVSKAVADEPIREAGSVVSFSTSHGSIPRNVDVGTTNTDHKRVAIESTPPGIVSHQMFHDSGAEQHRTHLHRDRPHGHHHGHSHDLSSVRAIAYTVIAGDGLHNFCDGIAIGAAFATSLQGGLSTSIAVLCHELPHEVGDFAVLLHAGISVKSALFCNVLSSVLCAIGTVIGFLAGRNESVHSYLFMLTAGMFVYIALVDMMPELTTNHLKGHRNCHRPSVLFMWQNVGILLGCGIMLMIALFEGGII